MNGCHGTTRKQICRYVSESGFTGFEDNGNTKSLSGASRPVPQRYSFYHEVFSEDADHEGKVLSPPSRSSREFLGGLCMKKHFTTIGNSWAINHEGN